MPETLPWHCRLFRCAREPSDGPKECLPLAEGPSLLRQTIDVDLGPERVEGSPKGLNEPWASGLGRAKVRKRTPDQTGSGGSDPKGIVGQRAQKLSPLFSDHINK